MLRKRIDRFHCCEKYYNKSINKDALMKTRMFVALLVLLCVFSSTLIADVSDKDITKALVKNLTHPYLFFTEDEKESLLERIKSDPESNDILLKEIAEAERMLFLPIEMMPPVPSKLSHYLNDNSYAQYLGKNIERAFHLAFVYQMTGEQKYAEKAYEFADAVAELPSWVHTSYEKFFIIYTRVWPWNVSDDQVNFTFNHRAGSYTREMAMVYDWLYPALNKRQRDRIRGGLIENAITRVRGNYEYHWWASAYRCNWCGVCNSGLGVAALALLTEDPHLTDVVAESYNRIGRMFDEIGEDGGWQEGCGYWSYGVSTSMFFADTLKRLTDGKYNLFKHQKIASNTVNCPLYNFIPPNKTVDFDDSGNGLVGYTYLYNKLAEETGSKEAAWYRNLFGQGESIYDLLWPRSDVTPGLPEQASHHFSTIDWAVLRSDFTDTENVFLACKAGFHDDPHHGHLDCGHFMLHWRGEAFISEPLKSGYDIRYFQEERWDYPHASSIGHNVLLVNGEKQIPAKLKDQPWKEGIGGKILEFRPDKDIDYVVMDPTNAYPGEELKGWRRHFILDKPNVTVILDEVKSKRGAEIETRFHSQIRQIVKSGYMLLDGDKGDMALIPLSEDGFTFREGKHSHLALSVSDKFKFGPYCGTVVNAGSEDTVIATIILPVEDENEAEAITASAKESFDTKGNYSLSFTKSGDTFFYEFKNTKNGLVMR